jgi:hypothetical protein
MHSQHIDQTINLQFIVGYLLCGVNFALFKVSCLMAVLVIAPPKRTCTIYIKRGNNFENYYCCISVVGIDLFAGG